MGIVEKNFKNWFKIMWQNNYIQLFGIALVLAILELFNIEFCIELIVSETGFFKILTSLGVGIPWLIMLLIGYLGFYKFWKELNK